MPGAPAGRPLGQSHSPVPGFLSPRLLTHRAVARLPSGSCRLCPAAFFIPVRPCLRWPPVTRRAAQRPTGRQTAQLSGEQGVTFRDSGEAQKVVSLCPSEHVTQRRLAMQLVLEIVSAVCCSQALPLLVFNPYSLSWASVTGRSPAAAKQWYIMLSELQRQCVIAAFGLSPSISGQGPGEVKA